MNTRLSLISALIVALVLAACGPSPAEQAATATQGAANIFATLTAQAPTATPTATPSPTPTATPTATLTPTPTKTPKPSLTPTPGLESLALTQEDLPVGFDEIPAAELRDLEDRTPRGSKVFGFQDSQNDQTVMGFLMPYTSRADQAEFDETLPELGQDLATEIGADTNAKPLRGLDDIGEACEGTTAVGKMFNFPMRLDFVAFRRSKVGVLIFMLYPDGDKPAAPIADLASLLDHRIQNFLAANP